MTDDDDNFEARNRLKETAKNTNVSWGDTQNKAVVRRPERSNQTQRSEDNPEQSRYSCQRKLDFTLHGCRSSILTCDN